MKEDNKIFSFSFSNNNRRKVQHEERQRRAQLLSSVYDILQSTNLLLPLPPLPPPPPPPPYLLPILKSHNVTIPDLITELAQLQELCKARDARVDQENLWVESGDVVECLARMAERSRECYLEEEGGREREGTGKGEEKGKKVRFEESVEVRYFERDDGGVLRRVGMLVVGIGLGIRVLAWWLHG